MAQFASGIVQVNSSVGTIPTAIWNPGNTSITTFGVLGSVPSTSVFNGLIVANTGTNTIYLSSGSFNAMTSTATGGTLGVPVAASSEMYLSGYSGTVGTAGTIWAATLGAGNTSSAQCGMPSVASVI